MTDLNYTHHIHIVDRSGSMGDHTDGWSGPTKAENATKGIRTYNADQAVHTGHDERATLSLYQFDTVHDTVLDHVSISDPKVALYKIEPRNGTALLDAIGFAITKEGEYLAALPEHKRPGNVIVIISTDGLENSSHEYKLAQIKQMIKHQQETYGWQFVFIGADIDAFAAGGGLGVSMGSTMSTSGTSFAAAYHMTSDAATRYREAGGSAGGQTITYTDEERNQAK